MLDEGRGLSMDLGALRRSSSYAGKEDQRCQLPPVWTGNPALGATMLRGVATCCP